MEIVTFDRSMAAEVAQAYNKEIADVPHSYPVSAEEYAAATTSTTADHGRNAIQNPETLVALSSGRVLGSATCALGKHGVEGSQEIALIRMLWYERAHRRAGQALLAAAEERLLEQGFSEIIAFDHDFQFPRYHLAHADLTDRWDHVHGLLGISGYTRARGEVFLDWPDFQPPDAGECPVNADVRVERWPGDGTRDNFAVNAHLGEEKVGTCICWGGGEFASGAPAQEWVFTAWLWVDDSLQGRGLGRYLLLRALAEARAVGYRHAAISTDWTNHRAILFYGNIGYRAVDWTSMYRRGAPGGSM